MIKINQQHFKQLTKDRKDSLRLLNKASMRGIKDTIVEKYSEKAHFVYELLQNADDVKATYVKFILRTEGLYFIHNGTVGFTVSPPNQQPVGHINAITSIGQSSKKEDTFKIGKFGIGFKSVFQYTTTPHIYDPSVAFCIEDLIVPKLLEELQHPLKNKSETLFFFPFNHPGKTPEAAQQEIQKRLVALQFPLLFLNNLRKIEWATPEEKGNFNCIVTEEKRAKKSKGSPSLLRFVCQKQIGAKTKEQRLVKIIQQETKNKMSYSLVFLLSEEGVFQTEQQYPAHCFFPTRVATNLKFLIHAPFLLTDSREGIKVEEEWNQYLIQQLADLLTDSFALLKKENLLTTSFFKLLPIEEKATKNKVFYRMFYERLRRFLLGSDEAWYPTEEGYCNLKNAYIAESQSLKKLINSRQLQLITKDKIAQWIFPDVAAQTPISLFVRQLLLEHANTKKDLNWEATIRLMDQSFFEQQTDDWLIAFYEELYQSHRSLWSGTKALIKQQAIIRLEDGQMVLPFSLETGAPNAYIPTAASTNYPTVKKSILDSEFATVFLEGIGLSTPLLRDELENYILPKFEEAKIAYGNTLPAIAELEKIIQHFWQCNLEEAERLIKQLCSLPILQAVRNEDGTIVAASPNQVYFENELLQKYFARLDTILWLPLDSIYEDLSKTIGKEKLISFFERVGVAHLPRFIQVDDTLDAKEKKELMQQQTPGASYAMWEEIIDYDLEGMLDLLNKEYFDYPESIVLWEVLTKVLAQETDIPYTGIYRYEWQSKHEVSIEAHWKQLLKSYHWILNEQADLTCAIKLDVTKLSPDYAAKSDHPLVQLLFTNSIQERLNFLTPDERRAMELGQHLLNTGLDIADLTRYTDLQSKKEAALLEKKERKPKKKNPPTEKPDQDEFNPAFLSSEELLEKQKELRQRLEAELQAELEALMKIEQLKNTIQEQMPYTFLWYKALLELEYILAFDQIDKDKSLSIYFEKVEPEEGTAKTITLRKPARPIPMMIEAMGDIQLKLQLEEERRTLEVEVVSIKDFSLRAKLKSPQEIEGIDFEKVRGAMLEVQNTIFTLEELMKSFEALEFADEENLQELLPKNMRFIFGPPGTGKTTYLAREEIMPTMLGGKKQKILVLAPTNKSADVLVKKVLSLLPDTPNWLFRFGTSGDMEVENAGLLRDGTFKISEFNHCCIVTTATRFPYDGFDFGHPEYQIKQMDWDIIIVDEASMIPLPLITYIIHQSPQAEIIIAGDPFQIEPIVYAEEWKGQNIYTLVNLQSFDPEVQKTQLVPHAYPVHNLITQYRSISTLGYIYSHLAYGGQLRHHRLPKDKRQLHLKKLPLKDINIIRFPVAQLETVLRPQKLNYSHYHIYSAILTAEIIQHLAREIYDQVKEKTTKDKPWNIGIICPYKAQAMLVDKIIATQPNYRPAVKITCGTIHSFQGDECDIILTLLNPPYRISKSPNMFLNRQNILNVAVSRAKDYLILLVPDEHTPNRENLYQINRLEKIIQYFSAGVTQKWHSYKVEEKLFDQMDYIEQNTFATTHQSINVYTQPEKKYEIRCEDTAIDVQIYQEQMIRKDLDK